MHVFSCPDNDNTQEMSYSEKYLIDSICEGDKDSFEELFKFYYNRLCSYAHSIVYQPDDAESIVKDVFVKMWEEREKIRIETSQAGYLYAAVRYKCINFSQRGWKKQKNIIGLTDEMSQEIFASGTPDASEYLMAKELEERVTQLVETLPPQCREIFQLSRIDELSYEEIAQILGISVGTVKTQIFRALAKIRVGLIDYV